jgi:hypothetical protein
MCRAMMITPYVIHRVVARTARKLLDRSDIHGRPLLKFFSGPCAPWWRALHPIRLAHAISQTMLNENTR